MLLFCLCHFCLRFLSAVVVGGFTGGVLTGALVGGVFAVCLFGFRVTGERVVGGCFGGMALTGVALLGAALTGGAFVAPLESAFAKVDVGGLVLLAALLAGLGGGVRCAGGIGGTGGNMSCAFADAVERAEFAGLLDLVFGGVLMSTLDLWMAACNFAASMLACKLACRLACRNGSACRESSSSGVLSGCSPVDPSSVLAGAAVIMSCSGVSCGVSGVVACGDGIGVVGHG